MTETLTLSDAEAVADLTTFIGRAKRVDPSAVRLFAADGVLAVYVPILTARGLLDTSPTILGLRTFAENSGAAFDRTVVPDAMSERIARLAGTGTAQLQLPPGDVQAAWTGIAPPRGGWSADGVVGTTSLVAAARDGAERIAASVPRDAGDPVVQRVRSQVWGEELEHTPGLPAGAAFAADALGFIGDPEDARILRSGPWLRVSLQRGHVLVRQR